MANTTRNHLRRMLRPALTAYCNTQAVAFAQAVAAVKAKAGKGKPQTKAVG